MTSKNTLTNPNTFAKVYKVVTDIPKGKVMTYGQIAKIAHIPNPRVVGFALHANRSTQEVPCHRVVNRFGELAKGYAFGGTDIQKKLLQSEGVPFIDSLTVDLENAQYFPKS